MRCDATPNIVVYLGRDPEAWGALQRFFSAPKFEVRRAFPAAGKVPSLPPSWRCECVVVIDHFEDEATVRHLESIVRADAGIPVIAIVDGEHPARLTAAGRARLHGVHRLVVKPWADPDALAMAVANAFAWIEHWRMYLTQPLSLTNPATERPQGAVSASTARTGKPTAAPKLVAGI